MSTNDIWYGFLDAGEKSSPIVRDPSLEASSEGRVWLYNYAKKKFMEYSVPIVEPKLRELSSEDISRDELDRSFREARQSFAPARKVREWDDKSPPPRTAKREVETSNDGPDDDYPGDDYSSQDIDD